MEILSEGVAAYEEGISYMDCPYAYNTWQRHAWLSGWFMEHKKNNDLTT